MHRVENIINHLSDNNNNITTLLGKQKLPLIYVDSSFDMTEMCEFFYQDNFKFRRDLYSFMNHSYFLSCNDFDLNISPLEKEEQTLKRMELLMNGKLFSIYDLKDNPYKIYSFFESIPSPDISLAMKLILHFIMYGVCILNLGTQYHHDTFLTTIDDFSFGIGCFAMTELGHGSNIKELETTAIYNIQSQEFIINTPNKNAQKYWIGNAKTACISVVFAQLYIDDKCYGVHPFIVPLRDNNNNLYNGIRINSCGNKGGLQGLDIGCIWFNNITIPRLNLLNRFGNVTIKGKYKSSIKNQRQRLQYYLYALIPSRVILSLGGLNMARGALSIATIYACNRKQFGNINTKEENILMSYHIHQLRLIPHIVDNYAISIFSQYIKQLYSKEYNNISNNRINKNFNILVSVLKVASSYHVFDSSQISRECCGGQGYLSRNYIIECRNDSDIFKTLDGDNILLLQQIAEYIVSKFAKKYGNSSGQFYYATKRAKSFISENPLDTFKRNINYNHLMDSSFHSQVFIYREFHLVRSLASRIHKKVLNGSSVFDVWNELGDHVELLGKAYIERVIHESFINSIKQLSNNSSIKQILQELSSFYALWNINKYNGWFLERGYFSSIKTKAIRKLTNKLCFEISKSVEALVNSWAIPQYFYENTIGSVDYLQKL